MAGAEGFRDVSRGAVARNGVLEEGDLGVEHRHVDLDPLTGSLAVVEGGVHANGGEESGRDVADGGSDAGGGSASGSREAHESPHGLDHHVVGGPGGIRACVPKAGCGGVDEPREAFVEGVPAVAQPLHGARAEVFHQYVRSSQQAVEVLAVLFVLEIETDALFAAVEGRKIGRPLPDEGADLAGVVAAFGVFHLDHPGTEVCQHQGAERAGQHPCQVENGDIRERAGHGGSHVRTLPSSNRAREVALCSLKPWGRRKCREARCRIRLST